MHQHRAYIYVMRNRSIHADSELVSKALAGDHISFQTLSERHRKRITSLARRALGQIDDAEDVAQEVMAYAYVKLSLLRDTSEFGAWLSAITLSVCADYRRRRATRRLGDSIDSVGEVADERNYVENATIHHAISNLSDEHRTVISLRYIGGWSINEIASLVEIPINTARSRLMAAKARLRTDLDDFYPGTVMKKGQKMHTDTLGLSESQVSQLNAAFPGARVVDVQKNPEAWMPFKLRIRLSVKDGSEKNVDIRTDITPSGAKLIPVLERLGVPSPRMISAPVAVEGGFETLCELPRGENLTSWALGGTPHRLHLATERAFDGIAQLQAVTAGLSVDPIRVTIETRTLADELDIITDDGKWNSDPWLAEAGAERRQWLEDAWFIDALAKVSGAISTINDPLVYTNYLHFFPQAYRIEPTADLFDSPIGAPNDPVYNRNPLAEVVHVFGHFGDHLLGLAMVWIYDCYPFVHTGFVEQYLWRHDISRRQFAPRLALKALQMVARDLSVDRPDEGGNYWDALHGWVEQGLNWV